MDKDVGDALRQLPRVTTSPRFVSEVMQNVGRTSVRLPILRLAASFAMMIVLAVGIYATHHRQEVQRLESMRAEHRRIETELNQVKAITDETQPIVVLENGDTRVVVDLNQTHQTYY